MSNHRRSLIVKFVPTAKVWLLKMLLPLLLSFSSAWANDLEAALSFRPLELGIAQQAVAEAEEELARSQLGLSAGLGVEPSISYSQDFDDSSAIPALSPDLSLSLEAGYRYDQVEALGRELDLVAARANQRATRLLGVREALITYAALFRARLSAAAALSQWQRAIALKDSAEARLRAGELSETEVARIALEYERAQVTLGAERRELDYAQAEAKRYGLSGRGVFRPARFKLPSPTADITSDYRQALINLKRAEASAFQEKAYGVVEELGFEAQYRGDDFVISGAAGVVGQRPGVSFSARYAGINENDWAVSFGALLRLDDTTVDRFAEADRTVNDARDALDNAVATFQQEMAEARTAVVDAETNLDFSVEGLELDERYIQELELQQRALPKQRHALNERLAALRQQFALLAAQRDATSAETLPALEERINTATTLISSAEAELAGVEQEIADTETILAGARSSRDRSEEALYAAWQDYVEQVFSYLSLTGGTWELR